MSKIFFWSTQFIGRTIFLVKFCQSAFFSVEFCLRLTIFVGWVRICLVFYRSTQNVSQNNFFSFLAFRSKIFFWSTQIIGQTIFLVKLFQSIFFSLGLPWPVVIDHCVRKKLSVGRWWTVVDWVGRWCVRLSWAVTLSFTF